MSDGRGSSGSKTPRESGAGTARGLLCEPETFLPASAGSFQSVTVALC